MGGSHRKTMAGLTAQQSQALQATPMDSEELRATFKQLDTQDTGLIGADEFMRGLKIFGGQDAFTDEEDKLLRIEMGLPPKGGEFNYNMFIQLRDCLANRKRK